MANTQISVLQHNAEWSNFPCDLIEEITDPNGRKFARIKFPDGDIKRVFHDRVRPFVIESKPPKPTKPPKEDPMPQDNNQFNPWSICADAEVYERSNEFSTTTICKTIVIIDKANSKYYSVNTYNDIVKAGKMEYVMKDLKKLQHKLEKKGYVKVSKDLAAAK